MRLVDYKEEGKTMATAAEQLEAMRQLGDNWDGYGGAPPRLDLIDLAQGFVRLLSALPAAAHVADGIYVSPTRTGGVLIEWEDPRKEHEVEFCPDGSISFLHVNKSTQEIETRRFVTVKPGVLHPGILDEIRQLIAA
jgi:hypothetical protein